jgi:hypothetical protein
MYVGRKIQKKIRGGKKKAKSAIPTLTKEVESTKRKPNKICFL